MWIRITFGKIINGRLAVIRDYFEVFLLDELSDALHSSILFRIKGATRQTMTIYGLSKHDAEIAYRIISKEKDDVMIKAVMLIERPTHEEPLDPRYMFEEPKMKEGMKDRIEKITRGERAGVAGYYLWADIPKPIHSAIR